MIPPDRSIDRPRAGRGLGWLVAGSLALNLFLAGWIVGGWTRPGGPPPGPFAMAERLRGALTPDGYARVAADLTALDAEAAGLGARFDAARLAVIAAASAPQFDAGATRAALAGLAGQRSSEDGRMSERLVAILARLDARDRRGLAEALFAARPPPR